MSVSIDQSQALRGAATAAAEYGFYIASVAWETNPMQVTVIQLRAARRVGAARLPSLKAPRLVVEEPYPAFFPSPTFLERLSVLA